MTTKTKIKISNTIVIDDAATAWVDVTNAGAALKAHDASRENLYMAFMVAQDRYQAMLATIEKRIKAVPTAAPL